MNDIAEMQGKTTRNKRVQARYDALVAEGRHGHYETLFRIVREEVELERAACARVALSFEHDYGAEVGKMARRIAEVIRRQP